jgi:polyisoprenoid-binding protein YceI
MKKLSFLLGLALFGLFILSNFTTDARNTTFKERFAAENIQNQGGSGTYNFDKAHSSIGFRVKHMGLVEVPGYFRDFTGAINYDAKDVSKSTVEFTAKTTSVDTGVEGRDKHLRSADFFEVEKHPDMTFKSTTVEKKGNQWMITGNLTMKGVTKQVSFPFNIAGFLPGERGTRMGATAETSINRKDFGVNYGNTLPNGTPQLSDDVKVVLNIEAVMPPPAKTTAE